MPCADLPPFTSWPDSYSILQDGVDLRVLLEQDKHKAATAAARDSPSGSGSESGQQASDDRSVAPLNKPHYRWQRWLQRRLVQEQEGAVAAAVEEGAGAGRQRREEEEDAHAEVVKLCSKATRALVGRACTLLTVYYLPTYVIFGLMGMYEVRKERKGEQSLVAFKQAQH
jgi:hypothetical protein